MLLVAALLLAGGYVALPWNTVGQIERSAAENDPERLAGYIDFPTLRENLKAGLQEEVRRSMGDEVPPELSDFLSAGASLLAGPILRQLVTPEGMAELLRGGESLLDLQRELNRESTPPQTGEQGQAEAAQEWRLLGWRFTGPSRVSADYGPEKDPQIQLLLERQGLQWRVVDLQFLPEPNHEEGG
nr:DUF2939 domain-containing protein [Microbulbifer guangxiensis]